MQAPRQHARRWRHLARGALMVLCGLGMSTSAVVACQPDTDPDKDPSAVPGSVVQTGALTAWYSDLTDRYRHGVLGDALEPTKLTIATGQTCGPSVTLTRPHVFEDLAPRLHDLDGDGQPEIITIRSHEQNGAQIAVYGWATGDTTLSLIAATPYIGRANRWLAPAGIGDLDGDGRIEIAYVDRPHLAKTLRIWRFDNTRLTEIARLPGVTNHRIGEDFITGGLRTCSTTPELILADAAWRNVLAIRLTNDSVTATRIGPNTGQTAFRQALNCQ